MVTAVIVEAAAEFYTALGNPEVERVTSLVFATDVSYLAVCITGAGVAIIKQLKALRALLTRDRLTT